MRSQHSNCKFCWYPSLTVSRRLLTGRRLHGFDAPKVRLKLTVALSCLLRTRSRLSRPCSRTRLPMPSSGAISVLGWTAPRLNLWRTGLYAIGVGPNRYGRTAFVLHTDTDTVGCSKNGNRQRPRNLPLVRWSGTSADWRELREDGCSACPPYGTAGHVATPHGQREFSTSANRTPALASCS